MASRNLGALTIDVVARIGGFAKGMTEAERIADRSSREIARKQKARAEEVDKAWSGAFRAAGLAAGGATAAFLALTKVASSLDRLNDAADATGSSIENLSALEDIAARTGTDFNTATAALVKFNDALADAEPDKGAGAVLKALNLDIEELKRLDPTEALRQTAIALSRFADDGEKARAVQTLFGKSVREVAPLLKDLAEAGKLNATVTTQQAQEAETFNKEMSALSKTLTDYGRSLANSVLPHVNELLERSKELSRAGGFWSFFGKTVDANLASDRLRVVTGQMTSLQATIDRQGATPLLQKRMEALREEADRLTVQALAASDALKGFANVAQPLPGDYSNEGRNAPRPVLAITRPPKPERVSRSGAQDAVNETQRYLENLQKQIERTKELTAVEQVLADIEAGRIKGIDAAGAGRAIELAEQLDAFKRQQSMFEAQAEQERALREEQATRQREIASLYEATRTPVEKYAAELERINILLDNGAKDYDLYTRAVTKAQEDFRKATEGTKEITDSFFLQFAKNTQDYLGQGLYDLMTGNFKNIAQSFAQMINRMVAEAAAAQLSKYLFGDLTNGGAGGLLTSLFGGVTGGFTGYGGRYADGGWPPVGKLSLVGEEGPELFVPSTPGAIIPALQTKELMNGGGRSVQVTNHFTITGPVDRRTQEQIAAAASRGVELARMRGTA